MIYHLHRNYFVLVLMLLLAGCSGGLPAAQPTHKLEAGAPLLEATFDTPGDWTTYTIEAGSVHIMEGGYRIQARQPNLVFGLHHRQAANVIIEAEAYVLSDYRQGMYGVLCRASSDGHGYYFLISADGNFSIRRIGSRQDDALVEWQGSPAIHTGKRLNRIRAVCLDDYLALYVNGTFVAEAWDTRYQDGYIGVTAGLPRQAGMNNLTDVAFDTVRVWEAK
jgi:hypothetical protein